MWAPAWSQWHSLCFPHLLCPWKLTCFFSFPVRNESSWSYTENTSRRRLFSALSLPYSLTHLTLRTISQSWKYLMIWLQLLSAVDNSSSIPLLQEDVSPHLSLKCLTPYSYILPLDPDWASHQDHPSCIQSILPCWNGVGSSHWKHVALTTPEVGFAVAFWWFADYTQAPAVNTGTDPLPALWYWLIIVAFCKIQRKAFASLLSD